MRCSDGVRGRDTGKDHNGHIRSDRHADGGQHLPRRQSLANTSNLDPTGEIGGPGVVPNQMIAASQLQPRMGEEVPFRLTWSEPNISEDG
jgi:hypothetical protein